MPIRTLILTLLLLAGGVESASAKGYFATRATGLPDLVLGLGDAGFGMSEKEYQLETGKAYRLTISSTGAYEFGFEAPHFFRLHLVAQGRGGRYGDQGNTIYELEFENESEAEIFFVPIKPGSYDFQVRGLERRGMVGKFVVK